MEMTKYLMIHFRWKNRRFCFRTWIWSQFWFGTWSFKKIVVL